MYKENTFNTDFIIVIGSIAFVLNVIRDIISKY